MTHYYYLASDQPLPPSNDALDLVKCDGIFISGFNYPIQYELLALERESELRELLQYIRNHTSNYKTCVVQVANVLNAHNIKMEINEMSKALLHEIKEPKQLLLEEGQLLTIKKIPDYISKKLGGYN